jgi:hypothetical protein
MSGFDFTPDEENQIAKELGQIDNDLAQMERSSTPQVASTLGSLYRDHPYASPGVLLSLSKAISVGAMGADRAAQIIIDATKQAVQNPPEKKKKSWWERNIYDKVKTGSRWTMAGLNFVPQFVQGGVAQIFDENDSVDGWFISTDLGTLIANDEVAGDGWFMGGRAAELQAQRAREYRGEIDGHAWTIGRGFASLITQPGSKEYNILSGLVDASAAIAIPAVPGGAAIKGGAKALSAQTGLRTLAGLADAESAVIDTAKVAGWLRSKSGRAVISRITSIENIDEAMSIFPKVDDPKFWFDVVDSKTDADTLRMLEDTLGTSGPRNIKDINIGRIDDVKRSLLNSDFANGRASGIKKLFDSLPGDHIVLHGGNTRDAAQSIRNMNNYLMLLKVDPEERIGLVDRYARALSTGVVSRTPEDMYGVVGAFQDAMTAALKKMNVPDEAITKFKQSMRDFTENKAVYGAGDDAANPTNFGARTVLQDAQLVYAPLGTAALESEMLQMAQMVLPDPRQIRRMVSKVGWITGKTGKFDPSKYGELRLPFSMLESFQQEIWRPLTLMTPGYVLRNLTDSAFRLSSESSLQGGVYHPLQWIQIAMKKKFRGDLLGRGFEDTAEGVLRNGVSEYKQAIGQTMRENMNPVFNERRAYRSKEWNFVNRSAGSKYRKGIQDEVTLLHDDLVTRMLAQGSRPDEVIYHLQTTTEGKNYLKSLQARWSNREFPKGDGTFVVGTSDIIRADGTFNEDSIRFFVEGYAAPRLKDVTRDNQLLVDAVANGKFTAVDGTELSMFVTKNGIPIEYDKEWNEAVQRLIDSGADLKEFYKYRAEIADVVREGGKSAQTRRVLAGWDKATDHFFSSLYPKRSAYLMQSPAFRQYYYKQIGNLIDEVDARGLQDIRLALEKAAKKDGLSSLSGKAGEKWLRKYIGDTATGKFLGDIGVSEQTLTRRIIDKINSGQATGKLSLAEIDSYAKGFALDETKRLFYNAAEKSNFADILRVVAPFGSAWAEVTSSWAKIAMSNPETVKRVGLTVQGLRNADPDNDGKGFFWKDPVSGEWSFHYPFSDQIGPLVSYFGGIGALGGLAVGGVKGAVAGGLGGASVGGVLQGAMPTPGVNLTAPAKTLTMGLNVVPGVGPMVQIAASKLLGKLPEADGVRKLLAPYGEPDLTVVPSWAQKLIAATQDPEQNRLMGDMTIEVMQVLQATGKYDLTDPAEKERLLADATGRARMLLMLRSLGQAVGPTRPDIEFKVPTNEGDMYAKELARAFRDMQKQNYDTAIPRFMQTFGEDAFLYVAGKSKATAGGLDASTEFGNFERTNGSVFTRYKDVAGYFAPVGTNFDYQVYLRQLNTGSRQKLKPSELIEEAQALVGKSLYKSAVRLAGPNPTGDQQDYLRMLRATIGSMYPGYLTQPVDINKQPSLMLQAEQAAQDSLLDGNPVAEGARLYFQIRQQALNEANQRGVSSLGGKKVADLRGWLRGAAEQIIARYPEFERLYDRLLFNEIDIDAGVI